VNLGTPIEQQAEDSTPDIEAPAPRFAIPSHQALTDSALADDQSIPLPNTRNPNRQVPTFELSLGIWCIGAGISRPLYLTLLNVMYQLRDDAPNKLDHLPKYLDTIKCHLKEQLPLLELRKIPVPLIKEKLPSSVGGQAVPEVPKEDLIFFNPIDTIIPALDKTASWAGGIQRYAARTLGG
jgi:hypothetical protein